MYKINGVFYLVDFVGCDYNFLVVYLESKVLFIEVIYLEFYVY